MCLEEKYEDPYLVYEYQYDFYNYNYYFDEYPLKLLVEREANNFKEEPD